MKDRTLHLSLDFELTDSVRLLGQQLGEHAELAGLYTLRLFLDWARQRKVFRPFVRAGEGEVEPVAILIEQSCGWRGEPGALIRAFLAARVLRLEEREGQEGFVLPEFELDNAHLLPGFLSIQQKGGHIKAAKAALKEAVAAVPATEQMLEHHGIAIFADAGVPASDQRDALALVMRIDVASGRALRDASEYRGQQDLMRNALHRTKRSTPKEIEEVLTYLMLQQSNPAVPKEASIVLRDWEALAKFACPTSRL